MGEGEGSTAKTSVWWDIENCQVPKGCNPYTIVQNISSALAHINYTGPLSISAYGDTTRISSSLQHALSSTGISLNHVPSLSVNKSILVDMLLWAVDNPAPANYLLISGNTEISNAFSNALHQLRMRKYNILLAQQPYKASAPLVGAAKSVWLWTSLFVGGPPLTTAQLAIINSLQFDFRLQKKKSSRNSSKPNGAKTMNSIQENLNNINTFRCGGSTPNSILGKPDHLLWTNNSNGNIQANHQNSFSVSLRSNTFHLQPLSAPTSSFSPY